jgi:hypothetical protein
MHLKNVVKQEGTKSKLQNKVKYGKQKTDSDDSYTDGERHEFEGRPKRKIDDAQETSPANYAHFQHRLMNIENPASQRSKHTQEIPEEILSGRVSDQKAKKAKEIKQIVQQTK